VGHLVAFLEVVLLMVVLYLMHLDALVEVGLYPVVGPPDLLEDLPLDVLMVDRQAFLLVGDLCLMVAITHVRDRRDRRDQGLRVHLRVVYC
jgi:hypothetical protein